jgi:predicted unusual protein kinase regulating ubiquinone biosynthesis (AarF/ABC1/UbiB family)
MAKEFSVTPGAIAHWESSFRSLPGPVSKLLALYEEELAAAALPDDDRAATVGLPSGLLERTGRAAATVAACVAARALFPANQSGPVGKRVLQQTMERYVSEASRLKGLPMKWAQMAWTFGPMLGVEEREALAGLAKAPQAMTVVQVSHAILQELAKNPRSAFASWSSKPFACGSVGQVHRAMLPSGEQVAVKVMYPRIRDVLEAEAQQLSVLDRIARVVLRQQTPLVVHDELRRLFLGECDYVAEAKNLSRFGAHFAGSKEIWVPQPFDRWSGNTVLTTELVEGQSLEQFAASASAEERDRAGGAIWSFYHRSVLELGAYNTDPHPGNFVFTTDRVAFLDFGRVQELSPTYVQQWRSLARAVLERDPKGVERTLTEIGYVPNPRGYDFGPITRLMWLWTLPCLRDQPFEHTEEYLRELWRAYSEDPTRSQVNFTPDMVFLTQLLFGVGSILTTLRAKVNCRRLLLPLLYRSGETPPNPYTADEVAQWISRAGA